MTIRKHVALGYLVLVPVLLLLPAPAGAGEAEDKVRNYFNHHLDDPRVTVEVLPLPDDSFVVLLKGEMSSQGEIDALMKRARAIKPRNTTVESKLTLPPPTPEPAPTPPPEETDLWPLTYVRSRVTPTGAALDSIPGDRGRDNIDDLVDALNRIYGTEDQPAVQRAGSNRLLLRGPRDTVIALKRLLALADAPWPQVQMNMWAVQVSGSPAEISRRTEEISMQVRRTRDRMLEVQKELARLLTLPEERKNAERLRKELAIAGIDLNPLGPLSLNESLVLLILHPNRQDKVAKLRQFTLGLRESMHKAEAREIGLGLEELPAHQRRRIEKARSERMRLRQERENGDQLFYRLEQTLSAQTHESDRQGFFEFRDALACFKDTTRWRLRPDAPRLLIRTGATVDRLLKAAMDAFAADMADLFLNPLLHRIQSVAPLDRDDGVSLVGRTRIVVTSGLEAKLDPEMQLFVETTRPKPFGKELLESAFPTTESGTTSDGEAPIGAARVLAGLSSPQALLLAAALSAEVQPTYSTVAPGIGVHIRPTVLPDGGAARLTIDARFGVSSTPQDADATAETWQQPPADGIVSHNVQTDAVVTAFDLFEISSFSVTASHPQAPFYVPILGRLPVIGRAFQFPRRNKETHFESLVLVNAVILPRSLELHRFYGRDASPEAGMKLEGCYELR